MIILKCLRCGSTDLDKSNEANEEQVYCNGCKGLLDIDFECDLVELEYASRKEINHE